MNTDLNIQSIERRAENTTFIDGLWDMYVGGVFLSMGLYSFFGNDLWAGVLIILPLVFPFLGKKYFTSKRLGYVNFGKKREVQNKKTVLILSISFILGIIASLFFFYADTSTNSVVEFIKHHFYIVPAIVWGGVVLLTGAVFKYNRFIIFGVFISVSILLFQHFGYSLQAATRASGGAIMLLGLIRFIGFLNKYPVLPVEEDV